MSLAGSRGHEWEPRDDSFRDLDGPRLNLFARPLGLRNDICVERQAVPVSDVATLGVDPVLFSSNNLLPRLLLQPVMVRLPSRWTCMVYTSAAVAGPPSMSSQA